MQSKEQKTFLFMMGKNPRRYVDYRDLPLLHVDVVGVASLATNNDIYVSDA